MNYQIDRCDKHIDHRGRLIEFLKRNDLNGREERFGQIYFVTFDAPRKVRGNHYHTRGFEVFGVVHGVLEVALEDVRTKERVELRLDAEDALFTRLTIDSYIAHAFRNLSPTAVLLDYTSEPYEPDNHDRNSYILFE